MVSRSRTYAPGYGDLTLDGAELEEVNSLHIFGATFDSTFTLETHLFKELLQCICFAQRRVLCPRVDVNCGVSFVRMSFIVWGT